jgi:hypothetical protein
MKKNLFLSLVILSASFVHAEIKDTIRFKLNGHIDGYSVFGNNNEMKKIPYLVSSSNMNSFQINLNLFELTWENSKWKYALSPAMGSYMTQNYAKEKWFKRWIYEAYVQRKWNQSSLALGVFSSPYTQETPKSIDQISYSRSLSAEKSPYFISGLKYTRKLNLNWNLSLFAMNGWQRMDYNDSTFTPSFGSLLEFKRNNWKFNWSTFFSYQKLGEIDQIKVAQTRFLSEWNLQYVKNKWLFQSCLYVGRQGINLFGISILSNWGQINAQVGYSLNNRMKLNGRLEYFIDPMKIHIPYTQLASESVGLSYSLNDYMNIGTEFRCFHSEKKAFEPYQFLFFQLKF